MILELLEYSGALFGVSGALLVASHSEYSRYGFILFLISTILLGTWSYMVPAYGMLSLNFVYLIINTYGVYKWFNLRRFFS
jgi:hypothetical protein